MTNKILLILAAYAAGVTSFAPTCPTRMAGFHRSLLPLQSSPEPGEELAAAAATASESTPVEVLTAEEEEKLGNLVANEEFAGLSMELADVVRTAVVEDLKKNSREFLGKEEYLMGDFSKEIDKRVKEEVAKMREKDDYEVCL